MSTRPPGSQPEWPGAKGPESLCLQKLNCWPWAIQPSLRSQESYVEWEGQ